MLEKLLNNKSMQKAMLSGFKQKLSEAGIKAVVITLNDKNEAEAQYFEHEIKVLSLDQWKQIQEQLKQSLL